MPGSFQRMSYNPTRRCRRCASAWSLIVAAGVFPRAVRAAGCGAGRSIVHPLLMSAATIATGDHYLAPIALPERRSASWRCAAATMPTPPACPCVALVGMPAAPPGVAAGMG